MSPMRGLVNVDDTPRQVDCHCHPPPPSPILPMNKRPSGILKTTIRAPTVPTRHLFKTVVTINVGPAGIEKFVHKELLCSISPVFKAAFNPAYGFLEAGAYTFSLPEERVDMFEHFVQWLYTKTLDHEDILTQHPAFFRLIRLYIFADKVQASMLKNAIVDMMVRLARDTNACPTAQDTQLLYSETVETAKLRVIVLDMFEYKKTGRLIETHDGNWWVDPGPEFIDAYAEERDRDEQFMRDLLVRLKRNEKNELLPPWRCESQYCSRYHEHDQWAPRVMTHCLKEVVTDSPITPSGNQEQKGAVHWKET